jgi:NAD(P)-dependent dehydrogenase (short-subunit alcohol dehydrogenase family)
VGISAASPIAETSLEEWRRVLATNLDGAFLGTKHAVRAMRAAGGAIVHVGSASGIRPAAGAAAYSTSKAGLRMLVRAAAKECRDANLPIRINLVSPAGVKTPMWRSMPFFLEMTSRLGSEEAAWEAMAAAGGGKFLEPDEVARVVLFLAGDEARHLTGVELPVDDGWIL